MNLAALDAAVRTLVIVALVYASIVALTSWAVRTRRISPFSAWPRMARRISDPVLLRLERRVIASGGSPQTAPLWLVGLVIAGGLILLSLTHWFIGMAAGVFLGLRSGPRILLGLLGSAPFSGLMAALLIRGIASWVGVGPHNSLERPHGG